MKDLLQRVEAKDYFDVAALLRAGIPLAAMLGAARTLFGDAFNPLVAKKTLGYFEGGELASALDGPTKELLGQAALEDIELPEVPKVSERLD